MSTIGTIFAILGIVIGTGLMTTGVMAFALINEDKKESMHEKTQTQPMEVVGEPLIEKQQEVKKVAEPVLAHGKKVHKQAKPKMPTDDNDLVL